MKSLMIMFSETSAQAFHEYFSNTYCSSPIPWIFHPLHITEWICFFIPSSSLLYNLGTWEQGLWLIFVNQVFRTLCCWQANKDWVSWVISFNVKMQKIIITQSFFWQMLKQKIMELKSYKREQWAYVELTVLQ